MTSGFDKPSGASPWSTWKPQLSSSPAPSSSRPAASAAFGNTLKMGASRPVVPERPGPVAPSAPSSGARLTIGIGDLQVTRGTGELVTHGLGSCIAVLLWDPTTRVAGMLHLMLPDSNVDKTRAARQPALFVDLGVPMLFDAFERQGGRIGSVRVSIYGGASIPGAPTLFDIGKRNLLAVRKLLWAKRVAIASEDVGGTCSRTVRLVVETGMSSLL